MKPRAREPNGFTLLELLISLTLLSLLTLTLFGGMWFGMQSWKRAAVFDEQVDIFTVVRDRLNRMIGQAYPLPVITKDGQPAVAFAGTARQAIFLAPTPQAFSYGGMTRYRLEAAEREGGYSLRVSAQPELTSQPDQWVTSDVLDNAREIEFAYFGTVPPATQPGWTLRWIAQPSLPKLIRIRVVFADRIKKPWRDLIIAPRIELDSTCQYDPVKLNCGAR